MAHRIDVAATQLAPLTPVAVAAVAWLATFGALIGLSVGRLSPGVALVCGGPALAALALAFSSRADREQYLLRLAVAALMLPILMVFWAIDEAAPWPLALLFTLALAAFVGAVAWLASSTTRLAPCPGRGAVGAVQLGQRIAELAHRLHLPAHADGAGCWHVDLSALVAEGHAQHLRLHLHATRAEVIVHERAGAASAAPRDAEEASMRSVGDPAFDPARPAAQRVAYTSVQATPLPPERLARVQLELDDQGGVLRAEHPLPVDHRDVIALFALLVTASGHAWQPRLFGGHRSC